LPKRKEKDMDSHSGRIQKLKEVEQELRAFEDIGHLERQVAQNCAAMVGLLEQAEAMRNQAPTPNVVPMTPGTE
jgi:hypothetical protein